MGSKSKRVDVGKWYYVVGFRELGRHKEKMFVYRIRESGHPIDDEHYASGNYFPTEASANEELRRLRLLASLQSKK